MNESADLRNGVIAGDITPPGPPLVRGGLRGGVFRRAAFPFLVLLVIFTGCSLHTSEIKEPVLEIPATFSTGNETAVLPAGRWWEQFGDKNLNTLMEEAFRNNLDIAGAYERLQQSMAALRVTDSSRWPVINIEGSGGRARKAGVPGLVEVDTYSLSAAASYEIDIWQRLSSKTRAGRFDMLATEQDLKAMFISISAQTADLYYMAAEQKEQLELSDQTISSFQDTLERVERRYRAGLVAAVDLYQSRQNLAAARAQRPVFASGLATTLNAIAVLTGRFPGKGQAATVDRLKDAPSVPPGIPSQLLADRPDVKAAFLRLRAGDERIAAAVADRFPAFSLVGTYGGASDEVRNILDSPNIFWNILLQAVQPVIDAGRRKAEVERTEAAFREALAGYHKVVLNAFREVEDGLAKSQATGERIMMLNERASAAEEELRLALDNYLQGLTDYLPVLTAQQRFYDSKNGLLSARRQLISDRIQLARSLGGTWVDEIAKSGLRMTNDE